MEAFLVLAVFTIFMIRIILSSSGYPHLGGGGLHIAHMLWGGFMMLAGMFLMFAFIGWLSLAAGAVLGGAGFGFFIDELGKFITSDNNYFYKPAVSVMYVIFVLLFLVLRALEQRAVGPRGYLANGLTSMREGAIRGFTTKERERAELFLRHADPDDPLTKGLKTLLDEIDDAAPYRPNAIVRLGQASARAFRRVVANRWFNWTMVVIFVVAALLMLAQALVTLSHVKTLDFAAFMEMAFTALGGILVLVGVVRIWWSRLAAFQWFNRGILVSLMLTQMFVFYRRQFTAIVGLIVTLVVWAVLRYLIHQEIEKQITDAAETGTDATMAP
jgi:hypothetical protein